MDVQEGSHGDERVREFFFFFFQEEIQNQITLPEKYLSMGVAEGRPPLKRNFCLLLLANILSASCPG